MDCTIEPIKPIPLVRRKRLRSEQRQQILARFHQGELTQQDFAAREGISVTTLCAWLRQERGSGRTSAPAISFQELKLPQISSPWAVEIVTPQNYTVRFAQPLEAGFLRQLLRSPAC